MSKWRETVIDAEMGLFRASGAHWLAAPFTRGRGAILTFHHVRPTADRGFSPNRGLEISPEFLDALLGHLRRRGYRFVSLDQALEALAEPSPAQAPFEALTFDDGYRDLVEFALPVLERHQAPFVAYITTNFAEGEGRLWWIELEEALARLDRIEIKTSGSRSPRRPRGQAKRARLSLDSTGVCAQDRKRSCCASRRRFAHKRGSSL